MISPMGRESALYNLTSGIERNTILNRGIMETFGIELPWSAMANNKDERIERFIKTLLLISFSLVAPTITMPIINRVILRGAIKGLKPEELNILRVSKKYLTEDVNLMKKGFKQTAAEMEKNPKHKNISQHFNNILDRYTGKEEELRKILIKAHERIFGIDFAISSLTSISIPWLSNYITEKRTGRIGYVGEFKMAGKKYSDKAAQKHEKYKKLKFALSCAFALLPAILIPKLAARAMLKPADKLGPITKFFKDKAHLFDYTDGVFLSKATLFTIMVFGDLPTFLLSSRDKHELKSKASFWGFVFPMLFGGEPVLNNIVGRLSDKFFKTKLMNTDNFDPKAGYWKKFLLPVYKLEKLKTMPNIESTKKAALVMYWANLALTTILLGLGLPYVINKQLKKDVTKAEKGLFSNVQNKNLSMQEFQKLIQNKNQDFHNALLKK